MGLITNETARRLGFKNLQEYNETLDGFYVKYPGIAPKNKSEQYYKIKVGKLGLKYKR